MAMLRPASEMKDSGTRYLTMVPVDWSVRKLKRHLRREEPKNPGDVPVLSLYRELGIVLKDSRDDNHNVTSENTSNYKYVQVGDFVVNKMKAWQGSVAVSDYEGIVSPAYYVYHFKDDAFIRRFFHYLLRGAYKEEFMSLSGGIRTGQWDLPSNELDNIMVLVPPLGEQQAIADYLDNCCSKIDEIIAEATASIEEYKELKQAVIFEAVTKGLNKTVPMKDSGVEWIGKMPERWRVEKIKHFGSARNGLTYSPDDMTDETNGILVIRSSNIQNGKWDFHDNVYVRTDIPQELFLKDGDIVICSRNGSRNLIGKNAIVEGNCNNNTFGAFMMVYRPNINNKRYMYWILNSGMFGYYLPMFFTATINQLTRANFNQMVFPYTASEKEQMEIVEYLDEQVVKYDALISEKQALIDDLQAYKKSLIYEVVTGKRRVV